MGTALATRPSTGAVTTRDVPRRATPARAPRLFDASGPRLEDTILAAWDELASAGRADCPVCGSEMGADGVCRGCESQLS